jgi:hypothetical protein
MTDITPSNSEAAFPGSTGLSCCKYDMKCIEVASVKFATIRTPSSSPQSNRIPGDLPLMLERTPWTASATRALYSAGIKAEYQRCSATSAARISLGIPIKTRSIRRFLAAARGCLSLITTESFPGYSEGMPLIVKTTFRRSPEAFRESHQLMRDSS